MFFVFLLSFFVSFAQASEPIPMNFVFDDSYCSKFEEFRLKILSQLENRQHREEFFARCFCLEYSFPEDNLQQYQWAYLTLLKQGLDARLDLAQADFQACNLRKIMKQKRERPSR